MIFKVYNGEFPLVLIHASSVRELFNQHDLETRQNQHREIQHSYHENWIDGDRILVPSFHIIGDEAKVGMGRHRFTLLAQHMTEIPAAFEPQHSNSDVLEDVKRLIIIRKMIEFEEFEYPDLPIANLGADVNSGPIDWKRYARQKINHVEHKNRQQTDN